jgi:hypothetical protein
MSMLMTALLALTEDPPADLDPSTGKGPEWGKAAPIGLLVILLMGIATFFLLRSMVRMIKKVPTSFDPPEGEGPSTPPPQDAPPDEIGGPDPQPGPAGLFDKRPG